ncbi:hypothetical protein [Microbacterium sp. JZ31]|uniref:hypothetical protein n=1 Tax=Microbacterium sp. JZ31 TaxID=1906274 RepID=UPI001931D0C1|nr:hypothetical protein [Microbacterium sp. JZ31]
MSQNYGEVPPSGTTGYGSPSDTTGYGSAQGGAASSSGKTDTAKQEAGEVKDTAKAEAGHVAQTAKQEASNVAHEAKSQAKQVYAQTKQQLSDQAATQQQRVADGLRSIGEELQSMARGSENRGMATEFVEQASTRLSDASSWLSQRDPGSLLNEVKSFARRKPGVFIAGALVAGLAAGRLTRALTENAKDEHDSGTGAVSSTPGGEGARGAFGSGTPSPTGMATSVDQTGAGAAYGAGAAGVTATGATGLETSEYPTEGYQDPALYPADPTGTPSAYPTTGAESEPTPMYDESRAANPAAEPDFTEPGEARDGR